MVWTGSHKIFEIKTDAEFSRLALDLFHWQYRNNPVYGEFVRALHRDPAEVDKPERIPFLPVRFFKSRRVLTGGGEPQAIFESSGTTGQDTSRHFVTDLSLYETSFIRSFESVYGPLSGWCILGLLPSYLERGHSSLVYMTDKLISLTGHPRSGFYLNDHERLADTLEELEAAGQRTLLLGVTYALLDFAERYSRPLRHTIIMETGGMKGRRRELLREEVHALLQDAFQLEAIHSEYGMTELLSQAYSPGQGGFACPPWMRVLLRDEEDPLAVSRKGRGLINIIDLANTHSCAFLATDDAGQADGEGRFSVLGRADGSDLRGCSLLTV